MTTMGNEKIDDGRTVDQLYENGSKYDYTYDVPHNVLIAGIEVIEDESDGGDKYHLHEE
jgi:hypothetical protein